MSGEGISTKAPRSLSSAGQRRDKRRNERTNAGRTDVRRSRREKCRCDQGRKAERPLTLLDWSDDRMYRRSDQCLGAAACERRRIRVEAVRSTAMAQTPEAVGATEAGLLSNRWVILFFSVLSMVAVANFQYGWT